MISSTTPVPGRYPLTHLIAPALMAAALVHGGYNLWIGAQADETENLETTRILAAARQFGAGPGGLYGPYGEADPFVLIQAPLYYRLTALGAWPLVALGRDPGVSCLAAGRALSFLGALAGLALVYRLATSDGAPRRAGVWAVLLVVAAPVVGSFPVAMRPDMLGVSLQTLGLALILRARRDRPTAPTGPLVAAYAAFALAVCVKQHYVAVPMFASCLLAVAWWRREVRPGQIVAAHTVATALVLGYFGAEEVRTGGLMSRSCFVLPGALKAVTAGSWAHVGAVFLTALKRSVGLVALAGACPLAAARRPADKRLDVLLGVALALELVLMVKLCRDSSGAWYNYALQATLFGAVLVGRALDRVLREPGPAWRLAPVGLAALLLLAADARLVAINVGLRREARADLRALLADPRVARHPRTARYFTGPLQHYNWRVGRPELTHDEWLYHAFEQVAAAEPRRFWLGPALCGGAVRQIIVPAEGRALPGRVAGVDEPLPALGFVPVARVGRFGVWERPDVPLVAGSFPGG